MGKRNVKIKKREAGICPKCGKQLTFGAIESSENMIYFRVDCSGDAFTPGCGWSGVEAYKAVFDSQDDYEVPNEKP